MRDDVKAALRGRWVSFFGANRERRRLENYLHDGEIVHDLAAGSFGDTGGRALLVATTERVLVIKDGWIFKNSQGMGYQDIRSVEIKTGLFFATLQFHGEGMEFEVLKVGRFAADHFVKLVRGRIGSRYNTWERSLREATTQEQLVQQQSKQQFAQQQQQQGFQQVQAPSLPSNPTLLDFAQQAPASAAPQAPLTAPVAANGPVGLDAFIPAVRERENPFKTHGTAPASTTPETGSVDIITKLERLDSLRRSGAVDEAEYNLAKQRLLNS